VSPAGFDELKELDPDIADYISRDEHYAARLLVDLPQRFSPADVSVPNEAQRIWELAGVVYKNLNRPHQALAIFWRLYQHMLAGELGAPVHKGVPLVWIADCFTLLGFRAHAKRYLMLTLCEDAIRGEGLIAPGTGGVYFRLVWQGLREQEFHRYAREFWDLYRSASKPARFPEAILQRADNAWMTELPSPDEALFYLANETYVRFLLSRLGGGAGDSLEILAHYLLSCMPGCRATRRVVTHVTDFDVACSMEGFDIDFRSEFGRYFICECKDWSEPADITAMAKFCRMLDSVKARFGILFSSRGISGSKTTSDAARERLKIFQDRGIVIVVLDRSDLEGIASGTSLIALLRERYEEVRLDSPQKA